MLNTIRNNSTTLTLKNDLFQAKKKYENKLKKHTAVNININDFAIITEYAQTGFGGAKLNDIPTPKPKEK